MADDPDMLDAFQNWMRKRGGLGAGSMPERVFFAGWLAARRAAPSSPVADDGLQGAAQTSAESAETRMDASSQQLLAVADDGLPLLPEPAGTIHPQHDSEQDGYTAEQYRQGQREAYEAGRRKGWFDGAGDAAELAPAEHTLFGMPIVIDDTVPPGKAEFRSGRRTITVDIQVDAAPAGGEEQRD